MALWSVIASVELMSVLGSCDSEIDGVDTLQIWHFPECGASPSLKAFYSLSL
jgi:hypothetical protein